MSRSILGICTLAVVFGAFFFVPTAIAYSGLGQAGGVTLEEQLILAERKVEYALLIQHQVQELHILMLVALLVLL